MWNGPAGLAWVANQELLDRMFRPFEDLLVNAVCDGLVGRVLDVGCGAGSTTLSLARLPARSWAAPGSTSRSR